MNIIVLVKRPGSKINTSSFAVHFLRVFIHEKDLPFATKTWGVAPSSPHQELPEATNSEPMALVNAAPEAQDGDDRFLQGEKMCPLPT